MKEHDEDEKKDKKKKKSLALKSITKGKHEEIGESELDYYSLLSKKLKKYLKLKKENISKPSLNRNKYPMRKKSEKKAMKITWIIVVKTNLKMKIKEKFPTCTTWLLMMR